LQTNAALSHERVGWGEEQAPTRCLHNIPGAVDWPHSSIHRHIEAEIIDRDQGAGGCEIDT